jgi:phosphopantothenoylcysteine synthetase/decarboxylase
MQVGDEVLHIELTRWADCLLVAPLSACYLAKLAHGLCDDLLTSVVRAWPPLKPILLVPVMHELMWAHPQTKNHLDSLSGIPNCSVLLQNGLRSQIISADTSEYMRSMSSVEQIVAAIKSLV